MLIEVHLIAAGMKRERIVRRDFNHIPRQDFVRQRLGAVDHNSWTRIHGGSLILCSTQEEYSMPALKAETLTLPGSAHYHPQVEMLAYTWNVSAL